MARHLADHRTPSQGSRVMRFMAIDRARGESIWRAAAQKRDPAPGNRRLVEFLRIARGRSV